MAVVLVTGCIDAEEAFSFVEGRLLALIFAMLAVGAALQNSGAIALIVDNIAPGLAQLPPFFIIWAVFLLTTTLTEIVSNNAVAVIMTPIAISLAAALGTDPRPLVVAVMIAASSLPVAGNVFMLAQHYGVAPKRVSSSILISTGAAIITVSLVIGWVNQLY